MQQQIKGATGTVDGSGSLTTYTVPGTTLITPYSISVDADGTGASGNFLPCLTFRTITGAIIARCPAPEVASGDAAEVSWFPHVAQAASAPPPSGAGIQWAYIIGTTNKTCNAGVNTLLTANASNFYTNAPAIFTHGTDVHGNVGIVISVNGHYWSTYTVTPFGVPTAGSHWLLEQLGGGNIAGADWFDLAPLNPNGPGADDWKTTTGDFFTLGGSVTPPGAPIIGEINNDGAHNVTMGPPATWVMQMDTDTTDLN